MSSSSEGFTLIEHPADIGIASTALTRERALEFSCLGLIEVMTDPTRIEPKIERSFTLDDADPRTVLRRVLSEVLFLVSAHDLIFSSFRIEWTDAVHVTCSGETIDPSRHELRVEVKAITSASLSFGQDPDGLWRSFVLVDV